MSKIRHLCLGVGALSLLVLGTFSVQMDAYAYSECRNPHQIVAGENLTGIAASYGVTVDALIEENSITDPNIIVIGQTICIPNGGKKSSEENYGNSEHSPRYNDNWGSYGVPGQSYDPSVMNQGGSSSQQGYGPQDQSSGSQQQGYGPQEQSSGSQQQGYGPQEQSYGPQEQGYGPQEDSYGPQEQGYGPQEQSSGPQEDSYSNNTYNGVPGKSYDPSVVYPPHPEPQPTRSTFDREFDEPTPTDVPTDVPTAEPTDPPE